MKRPLLHDAESRLIPPPAVANFFANLEFEAEAMRLPHVLRPAPKLHIEPRPFPDAELKRAADAGVARRVKFGVTETHPSSAQLIST